MFGKEAIIYLLKNYKFDTILDIGSGSGVHSKIFRQNGKKTTELDLGNSYYAKQNKSTQVISSNYLDIKFKKLFDCIWVCHVLEHQLNVNAFLRKVHKDLKENGVLAIIVPPLKDYIVGGHVSLWNAGLLLYNLVLANFNCREAVIKKYDYNITLIVKKQTIKLPDLSYDYGDIEKLKEYFPENLGIKYGKINNGLELEGFNGNISEFNWKNKL